MNLEMKEPKFNVVKTNTDNSETMFVISGLARGMASGYASALRMVMLEHVPGYKPLGFNILGAEDLMEALPQHTEPLRVISLAIEKIRVKAIGNPAKHYTLTFDGMVDGDLKAGDLKCDGLEVLNPDLRILTTSQPHQIKMQVVVVLGVGYVSEDTQLEVKGLQRGKPEMIRVNANFCPVTFVNFKVLEDVPIEGMESLVIEVRTNGSIDTKAALSIATTVLMTHLQPLTKLSNLNWDELMKEPVEHIVKTDLDTPIEYLDLDPHTFNILKRDGSVALRDLRGADGRYPDDVVNNITRALEDIGLMDVERVYVGE